MIRVLIADDHKIVTDGIKMLLGKEEAVQIVAAVNNGREAINYIKNNPVDIALLDITMPVMNGIDACRTITMISDTKVIALTNHKELAFIYNMVNSGAMGYLLKISGKDILLKAINKVYAGQNYFSDDVKKLIKNMDSDNVPKIETVTISLSKREKEILRLIVLGYTNQQISSRLFISKNTTDTHRKNLLRKLNVTNTAGLVRIAYETNVLHN